MTIQSSKKFIPIFLFIAVITLFSYYIYNNIYYVQYLFDISISFFILFFILTIIGVLIRGKTNCIIYNLFTTNLFFLEGVGVAIINTLGNLLPFSGGLAAKGLYLKKRYNLAYSHYVPATISLFVVFLGVNGLIGLVSLFYVTYKMQLSIPGLLYLVFVLMLIFTFVIWIPFPSRLFTEKWNKLLQTIKEGWQELGRDKSSFFTLCILQVIVVATNAARLCLVFQMLSQDVGYIYCLLFSAVSIITRLVAIAPGGIGVREAIVGGAGHVLGFKFGLSALAVMIERIFVILICFLMAFFYIGLGIKLLGGSDKPKANQQTLE